MASSLPECVRAAPKSVEAAPRCAWGPPKTFRKKSISARKQWSSVRKRPAIDRKAPKTDRRKKSGASRQSETARKLRIFARKDPSAGWDDLDSARKAPTFARKPEKTDRKEKFFARLFYPVRLYDVRGGRPRVPSCNTCLPQGIVSVIHKEGSGMGSYTKRVRARTVLTKRLQEDDVRARAEAEGILVEDLAEVQAAGEEAAAADAEQRAQIAEDDVRRKSRSIDEADILKRGDKLRNRTPAVVRSLTKAGHLEDARWMTALSYARFRLRALPAPDPALDEEPEVKRVKAVEAEDKVSRLSGLANLIQAYRTRPNIVAELARRGMDDATLAKLQADAQAAANAGSYARRKAEATQREHDAVARQKAAWDAIRPMIRDAVKGHPELEALYAEC